MTTDELAAIVAAATERAGWQLSKAEGVAPAVLDENLHLVACEIGRDNAEFTANAPRAIIALYDEKQSILAWSDAVEASNQELHDENKALAERIRELEAQRDALEAHCAELENAGEWHRLEDELPPIDYRNKEGQFVYEESVEVEGLIAVPIHLCRWTYKDGTTEIVWDNKRTNVRHRQVVGWKPLPKP